MCVRHCALSLDYTTEHNSRYMVINSVFSLPENQPGLSVSRHPGLCRVGILRIPSSVYLANDFSWIQHASHLTFLSCIILIQFSTLYTIRLRAKTSTKTRDCCCYFTLRIYFLSSSSKHQPFDHQIPQREDGRLAFGYTSSESSLHYTGCGCIRHPSAVRCSLHSH